VIRVGIASTEEHKENRRTCCCVARGKSYKIIIIMFCLLTSALAACFFLCAAAREQENKALWASDFLHSARRSLSGFFCHFASKKCTHRRHKLWHNRELSALCHCRCHAGSRRCRRVIKNGRQVSRPGFFIATCVPLPWLYFNKMVFHLSRLWLRQFARSLNL
jgi:hypothetical protein